MLLENGETFLVYLTFLTAFLPNDFLLACLTKCLTTLVPDLSAIPNLPGPKSVTAVLNNVLTGIFLVNAFGLNF